MLKRLCSLILCLALLNLTGSMSFATSLLGSRIGAPQITGSYAQLGAITTVAMATLDNGWDARFAADSVLDVIAVTMSWGSITAAGQVTVRIETDDGTGKPSGTLYDAAAVMTAQTPSAGNKTYTFAVAPTTGMTIGTIYHVLIITTTGGTTMTLNSHTASATVTTMPTSVLTGASVTTRSNFAVVANSTPAIMLTRTGGGFTAFSVMTVPFGSTFTTSNIFTTNAVAAKITTQGTLSVTGYVIDNITLVGAPAGDLRIRLFDGADAVVAGSTVTVDKDTVVTAKGIKVPLGTAISIAAATYHVVLDSASSADNTHCYALKSPIAFDATAIPNSIVSTGTLDGSGNLSGAWSDATTSHAPVALLIDGVTNSAAGGGIIGG